MFFRYCFLLKVTHFIKNYQEMFCQIPSTRFKTHILLFVESPFSYLGFLMGPITVTNAFQIFIQNSSTLTTYSNSPTQNHHVHAGPISKSIIKAFWPDGMSKTVEWEILKRDNKFFCNQFPPVTHSWINRKTPSMWYLCLKIL